MSNSSKSTNYYWANNGAYSVMSSSAHNYGIWWYEQRRDSHEIDHDSGAGLNFSTEDVNGDGTKDIVVANKKGVVVFECRKPW